MYIMKEFTLNCFITAVLEYYRWNFIYSERAEQVIFESDNILFLGMIGIQWNTLHF